MGSALGLFMLAFVLCYLLTPLVRGLMIRLGIFDPCSRRKVHRAPVPSMGGLAIYAAFFIALLAAGDGPWSETYILLAGGTLIVVVGVLDDLWDLPVHLKFLGQLLAAAVVIYAGFRIDFVTNPLGGMIYLGRLAVPVTLLWILSITNALNFIDGLDGLAAGVSTIAALTLMTVALSGGQVHMAIIAASLAGAAAGFLRHNFNPARIFMGDTGSMFLGFTLAAIAVRGALKGPAAMTLVVPVLALGVPIFDTLCAVIRRGIHGRSIFAPDLGHFHHRLLAMGLSQRKAVVVIYLLSALLGLAAVLINGATPVEGGIVLVAIGCILVLIARYTGVIEVGRGDEHTGEVSSR